jgi:UDP-N-acetylglucosamine 1-carboxyvinyltransferase
MSDVRIRTMGTVERFRVEGGSPLHGSVRVGGAKNSALKLLAATLLAEGTHRIGNVPDIADIRVMRAMLERLGCTVTGESTLEITVPDRPGSEAPYDLVRQMRASIIVLGPLLARLGHARVAMPGGCNIGSRKIDLHLRGLERMGAVVSYDHGYLDASGSLRGTQIALDWPSHGATENLVMAASIAKGTTVIENAARDPEIIDLANMLNGMGAKVSGAGTTTIVIEGVESLRPADHVTIPDRLEAGTFLIAAAATGGEIRVLDARADHLDLVLSKLRDTGCEIDVIGDVISLRREGRLKAVDFATLPYPGFPTDLQPQFMVLCALADGTSIASENVFENRFMYIDELVRMGASIRTEGHHAVITGVERLQAAPVRSPDIRAGAALVIAALTADGVTDIEGIEVIDRGYDALEKRLAGLGAKITRERAVHVPA